MIINFMLCGIFEADAFLFFYIFFKSGEASKGFEILGRLLMFGFIKFCLSILILPFVFADIRGFVKKSLHQSTYYHRETLLLWHWTV